MDADPSNATDTDHEKSTYKPPTRFWSTKYGKIATCGLVFTFAAIIVVIIVPTVLLTHVAQQSGAPSPPSNGGPTTQQQPPPSQEEPPRAPVLPQDHNPDFPPPLPDPFNDSARANVNIPPLSEPFPYGKKPIRGINLGGWLVLEPFITPSLFDQFPKEDKVVDEWTLCEKLGSREAYRQLQLHYETFITEEDFKTIAEMGFDHVRIPTGHWAVDVRKDEPFVPKLAWQYLLRGVQWARKYGLRVMIELHTAPGSQNGWNHSGKYGAIGWLNGTQGQENAERTLEIVKNMTRFFSKPEWENVAPIFGVINEPAIFRIEAKKVEYWYRESYKAIRNQSDVYLTYHDGFIGLDSWNGFFDRQHYKNLFLETHMYLMFDQGLVSMPRDDQAAFPCHSWRESLDKGMKNAAPTMVGEFSLATNDCGKYLNGIGIGNRYEGTYEEGTPPVCPGCSCAEVEDWQHWTQEYKTFLQSFIEHQTDAFELSSVGWFFWTYKTENHVNPHWDYLLGWKQGWIPHHVNNRTYSCDSSS